MTMKFRKIGSVILTAMLSAFSDPVDDDGERVTFGYEGGDPDDYYYGRFPDRNAIDSIRYLYY